jgi:hypothetical protein
LVVPRSIPTARAMGMASLPCAVGWCWSGSRGLSRMLRVVRSTFLPSLTAGGPLVFPGSTSEGDLAAPEPPGNRRTRHAGRLGRLRRGPPGRRPQPGCARPHDRPAAHDTAPVDPRLRASADRRHGLFTTAEAVAAGHGHSEIQNLTLSGRWVRLRRGVLIAAEDLAVAQGAGRGHLLDCLAVLLGLGRPRTAVSHGSGARLRGFPAPRSADGPVRPTDPDRWRRGQGYVMSRAPLGSGDAGPACGADPRLPASSLSSRQLSCGQRGQRGPRRGPRTGPRRCGRRLAHHLSARRRAWPTGVSRRRQAYAGGK